MARVAGRSRAVLLLRVLEIVQGALLHPILYLFVGFAMCVFYLLLLSLSEHMGFDTAYVSAATATVALLTWYWSRVVGALSVNYGFLYLLLRLEDYALLAGSIGLFAMLAGVMYLTRRVNWYELKMGPQA